MRSGWAVLAVPLALGTWACGEESPAERTASQRAGQARTVARRAGLPKTVQDFVARYAGAVGETFSVTYAVSQPPGGRIVVDQRPPDRRVDLSVMPGGASRSLFSLASGSFSCVRERDTWACERSPAELAEPGPLSAAAIDRTIESLKASRADYAFRVGSRRLVGTRATCLVTTPRRSPPPTATAPPGPTSLCLSDEGAPLLVEGSAQVLRAVRYSGSVDGRRFDLPARPRRSPAGP